MESKSKRSNKQDLKSQLSTFIKEQKYYLELERQEEENESINKIANYSAKQLEKIGICIRKLEIVEIVYSSYGKYLTEFQKRTKCDFTTKITKYKFDNGDVVGLFQYSDKIHEEPLYRGIVSQFNSQKIVIAFDNEIELESLPKNICLVQLVNQITYDRIKKGLDRLGKMEIHEKVFPLVNALFNVYDPTYNDSEEKMNYINNKLSFYNKGLNTSQQDAVKFALTVNEIGLIHGPPGTGKTTTVVEIILQLLKLGNKILVVAPSNIAVDNIGEKLIQSKQENCFDLNFDLVRIGHPARLLPSVVDVCLDSKIESNQNTKFVKDVKRDIEKCKRELSKLTFKDKEKRNELKSQLKSLRDDIKGSYKTTVFDIYHKNSVILSTCVSSGENYLAMAVSDANPFDYVIIDECAQATECLCWISILQGKRLILAGDHLQLPPTIKSKQSEYVLGYTLFDRMIELYGDTCCRMLTTQYRMNENIMLFSSNELYEGKLKADDTVKSHTIKDLINENENDINDTLDIVNKSVVLLSTSNCQFYETLDNESLSKFNIGEVEVCKYMVDYLLNNLHLQQEHIGIITPYSAQVTNLRERLPWEDYSALEISTVDGFQGREKEVIILSLVRSNMKHEVGFLAEKRRLNVALTRPKRMLIIICDVCTVENDSFINKLCEYMDANAFYVEIIGSIFEYDTVQDIQSRCIDIKSTNKKDENEGSSSNNNDTEKSANKHGGGKKGKDVNEDISNNKKKKYNKKKKK